jgi:hypothetical protein
MNTTNEQLKIILQALQERNQEIKEGKEYNKIMESQGIAQLFPYDYNIDIAKRGFK